MRGYTTYKGRFGLVFAVFPPNFSCSHIWLKYLDDELSCYNNYTLKIFTVIDIDMSATFFPKIFIHLVKVSIFT